MEMDTTFRGRKQLPNATAVLILGILSMITCCCYGIPGLIFGIIALILAAGDQKRYNVDPDAFTNYGNLKAGKILAIIGIVLSVLVIVLLVFLVLSLGLDAFESEEAMLEAMRERWGIETP